MRTPRSPSKIAVYAHTALCTRFEPIKRKSPMPNHQGCASQPSIGSVTLHPMSNLFPITQPYWSTTYQSEMKSATFKTVVSSSPLMNCTFFCFFSSMLFHIFTGGSRSTRLSHVFHIHAILDGVSVPESLEESKRAFSEFMAEEGSSGTWNGFLLWTSMSCWKCKPSWFGFGCRKCLMQFFTAH